MSPRKIIAPMPPEEDKLASLTEAMEDTQYQEDSDYEEGVSLQEAENEIGIADWIDPDTGEPAEGFIPHFSD